MSKRNSLNEYEVSLIKALIEEKKYSNQEIAGLINRSRGDASNDVSVGRISNIKKGQIKKYLGIAPASKEDLGHFLNAKVSNSDENHPMSDVELSKIIKIKHKFPNQLGSGLVKSKPEDNGSGDAYC
ncbi:hypothetical protein [Brucella intermedia]|uniref:hypothetical protein n=2 Tax=Brucella intermedia TaxID=94625 RepID=UPI0023600BAC|nr:hypothetical protein [Brucella intermedia]